MSFTVSVCDSIIGSVLRLTLFTFDDVIEVDELTFFSDCDDLVKYCEYLIFRKT